MSAHGITEMQKFVLEFMERRKNQKGKLPQKGMLSIYTQVDRLNRLRTYIGQTFVGSGLMSKSEMFDFMLFLLENYLKGTYKNYETFDEIYEREMEAKNDG